MALAPNTRIGVYEVLAKLGEGGMGEVYRARDSKLKREVALKVLPADVANDRERLARFQREAEVLAALNHPNIAHIYGIEEGPAEAGHHIGADVASGLSRTSADVASGLSRTSADVASGFSRTMALVMELVEGEDLAERLKRGAIPLDEALPIAKQIAEALEAAHEQGIIHRDLKPANIKVRPDGTVKVLDFGLAKALDQGSGIGDQGSGGLANSPTITSPAMTMRGMILGTAAYMAPEQAKGKAVDKRADIWAFGVVLYEMLTGTRAFAGEDVTDTIVAVMSRDPDWTLLPATTPPATTRLIRRCLDKDARRRLRDIGDARFELDQTAGVPTMAAANDPAGTRGRVWQMAPWAVAGVLSVALAMVVFPRTTAPVGEVSRFAVTFPDDDTRLMAREGSLALSRDGRALALVVIEATGMPALHVRSMSSIEPTPVRLTDAVVSWTTAAPSWSPDGRHLVITAGSGSGGAVRKIDPTGGAPATKLAEFGRMALWGAAKSIVYGGADGRVYRVADAGGPSSAVTELDAAAGELSHTPATFLPDGQRFIFIAQNRDAAKTAAYLGSIDGGERTALPLKSTRIRYAGGFLWFLESGTLMAQPFDAGKGSLMGAAQPVAAEVADFAVSDSGTLVIAPRDRATMTMTWFDLAGGTRTAVGEPDTYRGLVRADVSPDGRTLVFARRSLAGGTDVWQVDLERNIPTRLTSEGGEADSPIYSPDGKWIVYASNRRGTLDLYRRASDGSGTDELLLASPRRKVPSSISPDGSLLLFSQTTTETGSDVWVLPLTGDRQPRPFAVTRAQEGYAAFSPDGKWVAYCALETGQGDQVYVEPYPPTGSRTRLSTRPGSSPLWSATGREIYYGSEGDQIMRVSITAGAGTLRAGVPEPVLNVPVLFLHNGFALDRSRVLALSAENTRPEPPTVILNWPALLQAKQ